VNGVTTWNPLNRIDPTGNFDLGEIWDSFTGFCGDAWGWVDTNVNDPMTGFFTGAGGRVDTNIFDRVGEFFTGFGGEFAGAFAPLLWRRRSKWRLRALSAEATRLNRFRAASPTALAPTQGSSSEMT
jgi:hypothetical protein